MGGLKGHSISFFAQCKKKYLLEIRKIPRVEALTITVLPDSAICSKIATYLTLWEFFWVDAKSTPSYSWGIGILGI